MKITWCCLGALAAIGMAGPAQAGSLADQAGEPQVLRSVTEDNQVRIEELRVRGQTRRLTVKPKISGMDSYEIAAPEPGRAPGEDPKAGQRIWWSFNF